MPVALSFWFLQSVCLVGFGVRTTEKAKCHIAVVLVCRQGSNCASARHGDIYHPQPKVLYMAHYTNPALTRGETEGWASACVV